MEDSTLYVVVGGNYMSNAILGASTDKEAAEIFLNMKLRYSEYQGSTIQEFKDLKYTIDKTQEKYNIQSWIVRILMDGTLDANPKIDRYIKDYVEPVIIFESSRMLEILCCAESAEQAKEIANEMRKKYLRQKYNL